MRIDADHDFGERECPGCGVRVPANENRCPICGYVFPRRSGRERAVPWVALVLLVVIAVLIALAMW